MAEQFGHVEDYRRGWRIVCSGCRPRYLYSDRGVAFESRRHAQTILRSIRGQMVKGLSPQRAVDLFAPSSSAHFRVERWLAKWLELREAEERSGQLSPTTVREDRRYATKEGHFGWWWGRSVHQVSPGTIEDWGVWLGQRGIAAKTRRNVLGTFRGFVGWLVRRGELPYVPPFPRVEVDEYTPTLISHELQSRILSSIPWDRRGAFLAARHGLRHGEIRAANVTDVQDQGGHPGILVSRALKGPGSRAPSRGTKNRQAVWVPFDDDLTEWIHWRLDQRKLCARQPELATSAFASVALFPNPTARNRERRWITNTLEVQWHHARQAAGATIRVSMYEALKHSTASRWLTEGWTLDEVQAMLRHSDRRSTERYAKFNRVALVEVLKGRPRTSRRRNG